MAYQGNYNHGYKNKGGNNWNHNGNRNGGNNKFNQNKPQAPQEPFVNPYSFIQLSKNEPSRKAVEKGEYTGKISCKLEVKSPVFIPNTSFDYKESEHKHNVFYSYSDLSNEKSLTDEIRKPQNPVIPGSEIRGMIRNVYEQLTNSCFSEVDEFNLPYKRTNEPKELCIMCWDEAEKVWKLYYNVKRNKDYYRGVVNGAKFDKDWNTQNIGGLYNNICTNFNYGLINRVDYTPATNEVRKNENGGWYLHIPTLMKTKDKANKQIIYTIPSRDSDNIIVDEKTLDRFEKVLGVNENVKGGYSDDVINQNKDAKKIYGNYIKHFRNKEPLIVYVDKASKEKGFNDCVIYLSPACMGKEFFENKIPDILKENAEHDKCTDINNACPACRLFGMIGEKSAVKGRLRFSDSYEANGVKYSEKEITLPILATPRISATEFYLRAPAKLGKETDEKRGEIFSGTWNYDYYTTYKKVNINGKKQTLFIRNNYIPELAGRKVYWNRTFKITNEEKGKMNNTITPIEKGDFSFDVYFDKLTKDELENLLFCLELNDNNSEKPSVHKIGHGKPLGMGQVKLTVENVECIEYKLVGSTVTRERKEYQSDLEKRTELAKTEEGKCILRYSTDIADKSKISYPIGYKWKDGAWVKSPPFQWFSGNRGSVSAPKIKDVLPDLKKNDQTLKSN